MSELQYTTVDRILGKFHRDLKGNDINESDAIEWIGEALEFLKVSEVQEQAVAFIEIKNYQADLPKGLQMVLQIAKDNEWTSNTEELCNKKIEEDLCKKEEVNKIEKSCDDDCNIDICDNDLNIGNLFHDVGSYIPYVDTQWEFIPWTESNQYKDRFTPIRLANHTFFNSLVCKEKISDTPYSNCGGKDEYTIVGTVDKKVRFSFREGYIALAYIRNAVDSETGYPLIPDNISYTTAITYYIKWKMSERLAWSGREGYARIAQDSERLWLKYARQGKNYMKMPKNIDQFQNLLEQSHYLIPRHNRYYGYFGKLGKEEDRPFNNPNRRNLNYER